MGHMFVVTHTDLDGVASAAVYLRIAGVKPSDATVLYAEPYNLDEVLESYVDYMDSGDTLAIMDLGVNTSVFDRVLSIIRGLRERGVEVEWYDHHVWGEEADKLRSLGVKLFVDRSTCATGVVARYSSKLRGVELDDYVEELVSAVCAADLWRWTHHLAPKLFRVLGRRDEDEWRSKLLEKFYSGTLWDDEMNERLEDYVNNELRGYSRLLKSVQVIGDGGCRVAAVYKKEGPPSNSMIGATLLYRFQADIAVVARENGALSLRSRSVDVQKVAALLGGGGHPRAAGARVRLPVYVRLLRVLWPTFYSRYVASTVLRAAKHAKVCP